MNKFHENIMILLILLLVIETTGYTANTITDTYKQNSYPLVETTSCQIVGKAVLGDIFKSYYILVDYNKNIVSIKSTKQYFSSCISDYIIVDVLKNANANVYIEHKESD